MATKSIAPRAKKAVREKAPAKKAAPKKAPAKRSHLETRWIAEWERQGGPELVEEFKFHPTRRWRADFAHLESQTLIEIEGGAWGGRHTKGKGFVEDLDKYAAAWLAGWTVLRIGAHQVRGDVIRAVIERLRAANNSPESREARESRENSPESLEDSLESLGGGGEHGPGAVLWRACGHAGPVPVWLGGNGDG